MQSQNGNTQEQHAEGVSILDSSLTASPPPVELGSPNGVPRYDEFWSAPGVPRRSHERLLQYVEHRTPEEMRRLSGAVRRRIREQEVTFNILGTPDGNNRPWQLSTLPLVFDVSEFTELGRALAQRARLLNAITADVYGPQRLLKAGILPASLVLGHPDYWRSCQGWLPLGKHYLHLYAADIGRAPNGRFAVFSDRTAAPAGSGYALENRLALGRTLDQLFRDYSVQRIPGFFQGLRRSMERLSPEDTAEPRVVVLTPGMHDESSFEHAYLARYLGFELVEGRDLTVRDDTVYMKTLSGLRRVDVVLRRVYDGYCDPVDLREDSLLGVAGLLGAARAGRVGVANALGTVLTESAAFKAYLPAAAKYLWGEDLLIHSVDTRWCGDVAALSEVLGSLDEWVIRPAFYERRAGITTPAAMSRDERARLVSEMSARPQHFVAERWPDLSVTSFWDKSSLVSRRVSLRMFLSRLDEDYDVLPGALARGDSAPDGVFLSGEGDRVTMDVWVPSLTPVREHKLPEMPDDGQLGLRRGGVDLPSRLLDDIYWLGRMTERCDNTVRLVRAGLERGGSEASPDAPEALIGILGALQRQEVIPPTAAPDSQRDPARRAEALLLGVMFDAPRGNNLQASLQMIHALTGRVRSRLSRDAWYALRQLGELDQTPPPEAEGVRTAVALERLGTLMTSLSAVSGATFDNMVRGHAWLFMDMGRRVERGVFTLILLQTMLRTGATPNRMEVLLDVCDSLLTYRSRYLSRLQPAPVVDLVLTDDTNPRALMYQVNALMGHVSQLPRPSVAQRSRAEQRIIELQSSLLTADVPKACEGDGTGLWEILEAGLNLLWQFNDNLTQSYFSHATTSHAVAAPQWIDENLEAG